MKRILFAYPEVAPLHNNGGIGTFVFEAATLLAQSGRWEVDILADSVYGGGNGKLFSSAKERFAKQGVTLHDLDRQAISHPGWHSPTPDRAELYDAQVSALHSRRRYDVIEFPDWKACGFFSVRRKLTQGAFSDARLVVHLHGSTRDVWAWHGGHAVERDDFYAEFMEDYVTRYTDAVVSPTEFLLEPVRRPGESGRLLQRRAYPMQPGSSIGRNSDGPLTIACCSRLELRKGQDILARAIQDIPSSTFAGVQLVFRGRDGIGDTRDGSMSKTLHRILRGTESWMIAEPLDRESLAQWLGSVVAICVVPSRVDNYPNVLLEAARAGCLVVCSDGGGIPELLNDYDIPARVFPTGDVTTLASALQSAIAEVREGTWSRDAMKSRFEVARHHQASLFLAHYDALAAAPAPSIIRDSSSPRSGIIPSFWWRRMAPRRLVRNAIAMFRNRWRHRAGTLVDQ